jgi:hypothetical protein
MGQVSVLATANPEPDSNSSSTARDWNLLQPVAFRFLCVYFVLYIFPFPIDTADSLLVNLNQLVTGAEPNPAEPRLVAEYLTGPYGKFWDELVLRTGRMIFGVEIEYRPLGSGDTTWNYVQLFDFVVIAATVTVIWSLAAWGWRRLRRQPATGYSVLHEWLRVYVRFYVAQMMIVYGAVKVIKLQFAFPGPDTLLHTYGESSPMHLLWTFIGASDEYTWFAGAGEMVGGLLLCTRRTTLLGALVTFGVMTHVAALNFCYDVPVKLFSSHLVLMSLFLAAPDLPWLTRVLVLGQKAVARGYTPLSHWPWLNWTMSAVRTVVVLTFVGVTLYQNHESSKLNGRLSPEPPLFGLWEVEEFALDGTIRPPLTTDSDRWQRVVFHKAFTFQKSNPGKPSVGIFNMRGKSILFAQVVVDEEQKTITVTRPGGPPDSGAEPTVQTWRYTEPEPEVIEVEGEVSYSGEGNINPKKFKATLRHYGRDKFLLSNRGFHWINEVPYNQFGPRTEPPPKIMPPPKRP